jgi:hypothetical protein
MPGALLTAFTNYREAPYSGRRPKTCGYDFGRLVSGIPTNCAFARFRQGQESSLILLLHLFDSPLKSLSIFNFRCLLPNNQSQGHYEKS